MKKKPVTFVHYREDREDPRKQKAVAVPQNKWEDGWLNWWHRKGSQRGNTYRHD